MNRVGRSRLATANVSGNQILSATAYEAMDSLGSPYEIPLAAGQDAGGLLANSLIMMTASGTPYIRAHFLRQTGSGVGAGTALTVPTGVYLGYVEHTAWVSAGGGLIMSQLDSPNIALEATPHSRSIWVQLQAISGSWAVGASATPLYHKIGVLQD